MLKGGEEFLGTFRAEQPRPLVVEAFSGLIQNEDGTENYRIAALIDITEQGRGRSARNTRADSRRKVYPVLRELQHRVKNNLQLIVALIRLEARNERRGEKVNLQKLSPPVVSSPSSASPLSGAFERRRRRRNRSRPLNFSQIAAAVVSTCAVDGFLLHQKINYAPVSVNTALSVDSSKTNF